MRVFVSILMILLLATTAGCVPKTVDKGVAVTILRPVKMEQGGCEKIGLIWIDSSRIIAAPGVCLTASEQRMIADEVRKICAETHYLTTTTVPPELDGSEYHLMTIKVNELDVVSSNNGEEAVKIAHVALAVTLKQGGVFECYTAPTEVREFKRRLPSYEADQLPSDFEFKTDTVRRSLQKIVASFSPAKVRTFRPVRGFTGAMAKAGDLIDSGMYDQALLLCQESLKHDPDDATALYNAGLAAECMASQAHDPKRRLDALNLALQYYRRGAMQDSDDKELGRAAKEVAQEVTLYVDARERHFIAKQKAMDFNAPSSF